jgi:putative Mn2+ efflux pump MntP
MIKEAFADDDQKAPAAAGAWAVLVLTIATSIDALAVGVSLPTLGTPAGLSLAMIGVVTFLFSGAGAAFGRFLGQRFGRIVEVAGGLCLIGIGISIAIEHTR